MESWKLREKVVALLETVVAPGSRVSHDVMLPVIGSPSGRKRQCDLVITSGEPPREVIGIVEVQERGSAVEINEFNGWLAKMREVGANHLLVVSERPYRQSVIEAAEQAGPHVVKLLTLDPQGVSNVTPPLRMMGAVQTSSTYRTVALSTMQLAESRTGETVERMAEQRRMGPFQNTAALFSVGRDGERLSYRQIIPMALARSQQPEASPPPYVDRTQLDLDLGSAFEEEVWFHGLEESLALRRWILRLELTFETTPLPVQMADVPYLQRGEEDPLAWVSQAPMPDHEGNLHAVVLATRKSDDELRVMAAAYPIERK